MSLVATSTSSVQIHHHKLSHARLCSHHTALMSDMESTLLPLSIITDTFYPGLVDDCQPSSCHSSHGRCIDFINSTVCLCDVGYMGAKCGNEVDECSSNPCHNGGRSVNILFVLSRKHFSLVCSTCREMPDRHTDFKYNVWFCK